MFLWKLLSATESAVDSSATQNPTFWGQYGTYFLLGGFAVLLILFMTWSSRKRRKQQEEAMEKINALGAGTKVETIGGIFGTIVEMNKEEGTFVLETGSDAHGKTYIRFDRNAIARIIEPINASAEAVEEALEDEAPEFAPVAEETEKTED